jgi:hypothetical protein
MTCGNLEIGLENVSANVQDLRGNNMKEYDDGLIPDADTWRSLQAECPHCGAVQDIEEGNLGEITACYTCEETFIPVE